MLVKLQVIVLHTIKHGDNGLVLQCYSNTSGRISLYMRVAAKNKVTISNLHRLNILDVVAYNNGSSMPTIREMVPVLRLESLRTNIYKNTIAIFLSELLVKSIRESEGNRQLYDFLVSSINMLEHIGEGVANFHIHFMVHLTRMLGFMPTDNHSQQMPLFDMESALFREPLYMYDKRTGNLQETTQERFFPPQESMLLHTLLNTRAIKMGGVRCSGELRLSFAKQMIRYLSHHLGTPLEIKSLDILHEVFN